MAKSDANRGPQVGPSANADDPSRIAKQSRGDIEVTTAPDQERKFAKTLSRAMKEPNQSTYSRGGKR